MMRRLATNVSDMDRRMRMLERDTRGYAGRASATAAHATEQVGDVYDAAVNALSDVVGRFRGNARSVGNEAVRYGHEAARFGNTAVQRLTTEVEHRPLTILAVVAGLCFLVGLSSRRS